jgi:sugar phosphate isomerase/epimerase
MLAVSRRGFLWQSGAVAAGTMLARPASAAKLRIPPGIQLWTVKDDMARDPEGTLKTLGRMGYKRVEAAGWHGRTPQQFRKMVKAAGLECVSAHYGLKDLIDDTEGRLTFARDVGVKYVVASSPAVPKPLDPAKPWPIAVAEAMNLEAWRSNAAAMEKIGKRARALGLRFGYHNHSAELLDYQGVMPLAEIVRMTNPRNVALELDIGWVAAAGYDPVTIIRRFAPRIELLHIKDQLSPVRVPGKMIEDDRTTVIGQGTINWKSAFRALRRSPVHSYFVEQEDPFTEPPLDAARKSLAYMQSLSI